VIRVRLRNVGFPSVDGPLQASENVGTLLRVSATTRW